MNADKGASAQSDAGLSAADLVLRELGRAGISYLLANGGTDFPPIVEAYARAASEGAQVPEPLVITHENAAVAMAHGYYLITKETQAVMVHVNVGTANTVNALLDAARDTVPVLLLAGLSPISEEGRLGSRSQHIHWAQEMFDQAGLVREAVKWHYELRLPEMAGEAVVRALEVAETAPQGPVYLTLPRDVIAKEVPEPRTPAIRSVAAPASPDAGALAQLADWLAEAEHPLIITASAGRTVEGFKALGRFAETYAVPVVSFHQRYCNISSHHPMHFGFLSGHQIEKADLVIVLDCDVPWIPAIDRPRAGARVVHVGEDPSFVRYPMRSFPMHLSVRAQTAPFLDALGALANDRLARENVEARRARLAPQWTALRERWRTLSEPQGEEMTAEYVSRVLGEVIGPDAIVVNEYTLRPAMCPRTRAQSYFGLSPSGGLGWGLGAALGMKLAARDRLVVAALGDGAYVFANPTACHWVSEAYDLPVLTLVLNNSLYGAVRNSTLAMYPDGKAAQSNARILSDLSPAPAFEKLVEASGGHGERVERASDLSPALRRAIHAVTAEGRQALVNALIR